MSKQALTFLGIAAVVVIVVIVFSMSNSSNSPSSDSETTTTVTPLTSDETETATTESDEEPSTVTTVHYTDDGYSPKETEVSVGSTVTFVNDSTQSMWTASDPHPVHTNFSAFDAKRGYKQGESYSFTFAKAGTYTYHNHLVPGDTGTVTVK